MTASSQSRKAKSTETTLLELVEGMQFDKGYISPYFATDIRRTSCPANSNDAYVLIFEKKAQQLARASFPLLEKVAHIRPAAVDHR